MFRGWACIGVAGNSIGKLSDRPVFSVAFSLWLQISICTCRKKSFKLESWLRLSIIAYLFFVQFYGEFRKVIALQFFAMWVAKKLLQVFLKKREVDMPLDLCRKACFTSFSTLLHTSSPGKWVFTPSHSDRHEESKSQRNNPELIPNN